MLNQKIVMPSPKEKAQPETVALFVSDVHLHPSLPTTTDAFIAFLEGPARRTSCLYLLGDLFEYWAGDDDIEASYHRHLVDAIRAVSAGGTKVFWIAGNRDFLVGEQFGNVAGVALLPDPFTVELGGKRIVLSHGDSMCTDDTAYMAFRAQVRQTAWQQAFLAKPLDERKAVITSLRDRSKADKLAKAAEIMDVNQTAVDSLFNSSNVPVMIHGHTHRPFLHIDNRDGVDRQRYVLPDWNCDEGPEYGGWLALEKDGTFVRYNAIGEPVDFSAK